MEKKKSHQSFDLPCKENSFYLKKIKINTELNIRVIYYLQTDDNGQSIQN